MVQKFISCPECDETIELPSIWEGLPFRFFVQLKNGQILETTQRNDEHKGNILRFIEARSLSEAYYEAEQKGWV